MHPVVQRILVNGLTAAGVLAVVGFAYAQLAGIWLAGGSSARGLGEPGLAPPADDPLVESLRYRVPAMMALWGFAFVAVAEGVLAVVRGNRPAPLPVERTPDPAEVLLEELMRQAESANAPPPAEPTPSPSPSLAQNSPVTR